MMRRRAFSTLGMSEASLVEVVALAMESGWTGVEVGSADDRAVNVHLSAASPPT